MMKRLVFFDRETLLRKGKNSTKDIYALLPNLHTMPGKSFIVDLHDLIKDSSADVGEKIDYLMLCSFRNWVDYKFYKNLTLDRRFTNLTDQRIISNPLLAIRNGRIYFKWEEKYYGNQIY